MALIEVNQSTAAAFCGVALNTFRKWQIPPLRKEGRQVFYDLAAVARHFYGKNDDVKRDLDLTQERARLAKAQADRTELDVADLERRLIPAEEVERTWSSVLVAFRSQQLTMRNAIDKHRSQGAVDADIADELIGLITDGLDDLAGFDPLSDDEQEK